VPRSTRWASRICVGVASRPTPSTAYGSRRGFELFAAGASSSSSSSWAPRLEPEIYRVLTQSLGQL
jgi:hypothetical protein